MLLLLGSNNYPMTTVKGGSPRRPQANLNLTMNQCCRGELDVPADSSVCLCLQSSGHRGPGSGIPCSCATAPQACIHHFPTVT